MAKTYGVEVEKKLNKVAQQEYFELHIVQRGTGARIADSYYGTAQGVGQLIIMKAEAIEFAKFLGKEAVAQRIIDKADAYLNKLKGR
jgi:ABC-type Fe3+-hydroxamate transport system substrate-binding protein